MRKIQPIVRNRLICVPNFEPELIVGNKLSKKPQEAAKKLKQIVESENSICKINPHSNATEYEGYDVKIRQDYSNGTVTLGLSSWPQYVVSGDNLIIKEQFVSTVLPATAAVKRYTKALKEMVENPNKETVQTSIKMEKSAISKAAAERLTKALKEIIEKQKLFKENPVQTQISEPKKKWYQFWK